MSRKISVQFGLISAIAYISVSLIIYATGNNPIGRHSWLIYWMPILFVVLSVWKLRKLNEGYLNFPDGFVNGFGVGIISALIISIYLFTLAKIDTSLIDDCIRQNLKALYVNKNEVISKKGIDLFNRMVKENSHLTARNIFADSIIRKLAGQVITSFFVAAFFRKVKNNG